MATIKDVAKYTGLSLATISKYLNGGNVRADNRALINEAVQTLGYTVNRSAQSLKTNRTHTIGVIMPTLSIPFFGSMYSALDRAFRSTDYTTLVASYDFARDLELDKIRMFINNNVDGIILIPESVTAAELTALTAQQGRSVPTILIDRSIPDYTCDNVVIDNLNATYNAVELLINDGHKRIGLISGPLHISTGYERMIGYKRVQEDYGIPADNELIRIGNYDFESGHRIFHEFLHLDNPPTALCSTNYDMTMGAILAAHEAKIVLGTDMGFVGFDAVQLSRMVTPALPVVEQPTEEMGRRAAELMIARLAGAMDGYPQMLRLKSRLHVPDGTDGAQQTTTLAQAGEKTAI